MGIRYTATLACPRITIILCWYGVGCMVIGGHVDSCKTQLLVAFYDGRFWLEALGRKKWFLGCSGVTPLDMPNAKRIVLHRNSPRRHLFPILCSNIWWVDSEPTNASNALRRRAEQGRVAVCKETLHFVFFCTANCVAKQMEHYEQLYVFCPSAGKTWIHPFDCQNQNLLWYWLLSHYQSGGEGMKALFNIEQLFFFSTFRWKRWTSESRRILHLFVDPTISE